MDTQQARSRLEQLLVELDSTAQVLEAEGAGDSSELSHNDNHPADNASELSDADREGALLEGVAGQRAEVVAALARIDDGSYGTCPDCGSAIAPARLDAKPEALRCVEDQAKHEDRLAS